MQPCPPALQPAWHPPLPRGAAEHGKLYGHMLVDQDPVRLLVGRGLLLPQKGRTVREGVRAFLERAQAWNLPALERRLCLLYRVLRDESAWQHECQATIAAGCANDYLGVHQQRVRAFLRRNKPLRSRLVISTRYVTLSGTQRAMIGLGLAFFFCTGCWPMLRGKIASELALKDVEWKVARSFSISAHLGAALFCHGVKRFHRRQLTVPAA